MIFVSGSGCLGAKRESRNLLLAYTAMMALVLVSEVVLMFCLNKHQQNMATFLAKPAEYHKKYMEIMLGWVDNNFYEDLMSSELTYTTVMSQARESSDIGEKVLLVLEFSCAFTFCLLVLGLLNILLIANYFERFRRDQSNCYTNVPLVEVVSLDIEQNNEDDIIDIL
jgi:hypothetical protein